MARAPYAILLVGLLFGAFALACGGGGDKSASSGPRITDPAKVPSSTPVQYPVVYQIRQDGQISTSGGPTSTVATNSTPASSSNRYTVASGDTCSAIAGKFNISVDELRRANRLIDSGCTNLHTGDVLVIPAAATPTSASGGGGLIGGGGATPKPSGKTYTVSAGDTCSGIAQSFGVKVADLIAANNLDADCRSLKPGQTLKIP